MSEKQYIGVYWKERSEPVEKCAQRIKHLFRLLSECDPRLTRWYETGWTLEQALAHPVNSDEPSIEQRLLEQEREEGRMPGEGFSLELWNGEPDDGGLGLSLHCGEASPWVSNVCVISPPQEGPLSERLWAPSVLARIFRAMVLAWEPEWGLATSHAWRNSLPDSAKGGTFIGWLTYLSHRRGPLPPLPSPVHIEPVEDLGSLVLLTPERFTVSNPAHLALAREVTRRLSHAGLLVPLQPRGD